MFGVDRIEVSIDYNLKPNKPKSKKNEKAVTSVNKS